MTESIDPLQASIESLADQTYGVQNGFKTDIYFDPERGVVYSFLNDAAMPRKAYDGIDRRLAVIRDGAVPSSVSDALLAVIDTIKEMAACYVGTEFNDRSHKGIWADAGDWESGAYQSLEELSDSVAYYWDPSEWFEPVLGELKTAWSEGETAEQIIAGQNLDSGDAQCDRDSAIAWIESMFCEWARESTTEDNG